MLPSGTPPPPARVRMMQSLKVDHLKDALGRLRLSKSGLKAELQARLLAALTAPASRALAERAIGDVYSLAHGVPLAPILSPGLGGGGAGGSGGGKMPSLGGAEAYRAAMLSVRCAGFPRAVAGWQRRACGRLLRGAARCAAAVVAWRVRACVQRARPPRAHARLTRG
jgi:hypothetical protein